MVPSQQLSDQAGAKMPRYLDFFPRAKQIVRKRRFPLFAHSPQNRHFLQHASEMATYHHITLFTIQKPCFHGAKSSEISIFWHSESPIKQLSSEAGAKISTFPWGGGRWGGAGTLRSQQLSSQAGAKMPRYHDFFPRARQIVPNLRIPTVAYNPKNR